MTTPKTIKEILVLFYSIVLSSSKTKDISYDDFIDWLDENPTAVVDFTNWLKQTLDVQSHITGKRGEDATKRAKKIVKKDTGKN